MKSFSLAPGLEAEITYELLILRGELSRSNAPALQEWLQDLPSIAKLELAEFDIEDGVAATYAVNAVRLLRSRVSLLQIVGAPQVLAHNLYRTGLLAEGGIELKQMREDEAYG